MKQGPSRFAKRDQSLELLRGKIMGYFYFSLPVNGIGQPSNESAFQVRLDKARSSDEETNDSAVVYLVSASQ